MLATNSAYSKALMILPYLAKKEFVVAHGVLAQACSTAWGYFYALLCGWEFATYDYDSALEGFYQAITTNGVSDGLFALLSF